jgi:signal transduction histidine kinase
VAAVFFLVYIPVTFFIFKKNIEGWILLATFLFFIISMLSYYKTKNIQLISHLFAMLGFPVLMPWLITGGPSGAGFWWSLVNVVWVYFVTNKRAAIFWCSAHLIIAFIIVVLSQLGLFSIAYSISELLNFLFAFVMIFILVYLFDIAREYYLQLSVKRAEELVSLNKDLTLANHELEQFAYAASHDLQEPLRTTYNFINLLEKKYLNHADKESIEYITLIKNATLRMQDLIKDLLDFSKVGRNITFEAVDCNIVLKEVLAEMNSTIKENNAKISSAVLPVLNGNKMELKRLFQNLLSNGIKFQKKDVLPEIQISVTETNDDFVFAFKDNGIGIEEKYAEKIFVIFQRLHNVEEYPGTGIGLAICKKIVVMHGGKIWVESEPGRGSIFYFTIPKVKIISDDVNQEHENLSEKDTEQVR